MGTVRKREWGRVALFVAAAITALAVQQRIDRQRPQQGSAGELMYFPSTQFTQAATVGYNNVVGDWVWLDIIQYYGRHSLSDLQYQYLKHMLEVLVVLIPSFTHAYSFGSLLLITDCNDWAGGMSLLDQGQRQEPAEWSIPFTRGFYYYVFAHNYREASRWFTIASRLPDAPEMAGRFAAFARQKGHDLTTARELWMAIRNKSHNPIERLMAEGYIAKIDRTILLRQLQQSANAFRARAGRPPHNLYELVGAGFLAAVPRDPLGGKFSLDARTGNVIAFGGRVIFNE